MMKWKARKETTNIGVMELNNMTFSEDFLEVYIDICGMSEDLKAEVDKAIEIEKVQCSQYWDELLSEHEESKRFSTVWSDNPVVIDFSYLSVTLETGKPIKYSINVGFHDAGNGSLNPVASIDIDLSEYANELKCAIIQVLVGKFFGK